MKYSTAARIDNQCIISQVDAKRRELFDVIFKEIQPHIERFREAAEQLERHTARRVRLDAAALRRAQQGMSMGGANDEEEQEDEGEEEKLDFAAAVAAFPISAHSAILKTAVFLKDTEKIEVKEANELFVFENE